MTLTSLRVTAALVLAVALVAPAEAQRRADRDRDDDRSERSEDHRYGERQGEDGRLKQTDRDRDRSRTAERRGDDRYERNRRGERGNGPAFCRSGAGHPVFGWDWCRERGWDRSASLPVRWERRTWDDVIFRRTDRRGVLDRRDLGDVLGSVIIGRLDTRRREMGARDSYAGRWVTSGNGRELLVTAGGIPLARLVDRNGDRRVDGVYLAER
ncbi:MAG TPA: hypothetical protein VF039_12635 [Longimicrobiales bacterium]